MLKYFNDKCLQELIDSCGLHRHTMCIADQRLRDQIQQEVDKYFQTQHEQGTIFYVHATKTKQLSKDTNDDIYRFNLKVYLNENSVVFGVTLKDSIVNTIFGEAK